MKSRALPQLRMFLRMTGMFLAWSVVVGHVISQGAGFNHVMNFATIGAFFGAFLGLIAVVVALLFGEVRDHGQFKLTLGIFTSLLPAFLVLFFLHILSTVTFRASEYIFVLAIVSILPCVIWFSQIVARKYLQEITPRKRKEKPPTFGTMPAAGDSIDDG